MFKRKLWVLLLTVAMANLLPFMPLSNGPVAPSEAEACGPVCVKAAELAVRYGGRYAGWIREASKWSPVSIQRAERSFLKVIAEHEGKIRAALGRIGQLQSRIAQSKNPRSIPQLRSAIQAEERYIEKWRKDIERNSDYLNIVRELLSVVGTR